jgi:hypothetical protein
MCECGCWKELVHQACASTRHRALVTAAAKCAALHGAEVVLLLASMASYIPFVSCWHLHLSPLPQGQGTIYRKYPQQQRRCHPGASCPPTPAPTAARAQTICMCRSLAVKQSSNYTPTTLRLAAYRAGVGPLLAQPRGFQGPVGGTHSGQGVTAEYKQKIIR